jgi:hypothetical protein
MALKAKGTGNDFSPQQLEAIELLSNGDLNLSEIQAKLDISADTLWRWRKNPQFMDAVISSSRNNLRNELPIIYKKLHEKSSEGDWHHIKILLDHLDKLEENKNKSSFSSITFTWGVDGNLCNEEQNNNKPILDESSDCTNNSSIESDACNT